MPQKIVTTSIDIKNQPSQKVIEALKQRFESLDIFDASFTIENKQLLVTSSQGDLTIDQYNGIFQNHTIEFWHTGFFEASELSEIKDLKKTFRSFTPNIYTTNSNNPSHGLKAVLGYCTNIDSIDYVQNQLSATLDSGNEMQLFRSKNTIFTSKEVHQIFVIDTDKQKKAPINNTHIQAAEARVNDMHGDIQLFITFTSDGAKRFENMTKRAFQNYNAPIAILINNEVASAPSVQGVIAGGKCQISGFQSLAEAEQIATSLSLGNLDYELRILNQEIN